MLVAAFYKAAFGNWVDRAIDALTRNGGYSHMELFNVATNEMFSSSPRDGGVRIKPLAYDVEKWELIALQWLSEEQAAVVWAWAQKRAQSGVGYDFDGVMHFPVPLIQGDPEKDFCSETCFMAMQQAGEFADVVSGDTDPNSGAGLLMERWSVWANARLDDGL